jgi:addiction module RelE/StbE family toxin
MRIRHHRRFVKQFRKLPPQMQRKALSTIAEFAADPRTPRLHNHALKGNFLGQRAISVTGDIRIVFQEEGNYQRVTLLRVGSHSEAYK